MIDPPLSDRLVALYATWLDRDDLGQRYADLENSPQAIGVTSVRGFLAELLKSSSEPNAQFQRPAALDHPDSTLTQLLGSPLVTRAGRSGLIEAVARHALCVQAIPRLLLEGTENRNQAEEGVPSPVLEPADRAALADTLLAVLKSRLGQRTIRSFFAVPVASNGYRLWDEHRRAPEGYGVALVRHVIETEAGSVSVDLVRYPDDGEAQLRAYEWRAELREAPGSERPDAVAYGMAYCFDRVDGLPIAGTWDLLTAADALADVDLLQVNAFLDQHRDAEALIEAGDLAFVWLWERRSGARAGAGQACLRAALTDLRRRLRHIRTVVIDLKPYQYVVADAAGMPTSLHVEKLEAMDRLQAFVDGLDLGDRVKGHCRYIVNRDGDDPTAAMRALGLAGLAQHEPPWLGEG